MFNKHHVALQDGHILWGEFRRNYPIVLKKKKKKKEPILLYAILKMKSTSKQPQ